MSYRERFLALCSRDERDEADRMCGGLSNNDNSPLFWALLQIKQLPSAIAKVLGDNVEAMREINQGKKVALLQIIASRLFAAVIHAFLVLALALGAFVIITKKQEARLGTLVENSRSLLQQQKQLAADQSEIAGSTKELQTSVGSAADKVATVLKNSKVEIIAEKESAMDDFKKAAASMKNASDLLRFLPGEFNFNAQGDLVVYLNRQSFEVIDDQSVNGMAHLIFRKPHRN